MEAKHMVKQVKKRKKTPLAKVILTDVLAVALLLCVFSFFHHVLPALQASAVKKAQAAAATPVPVVTATPAPTAEPAAVTAAPELSPEPAAQVTPEPTPEPTPDTRTEWQIKFADKFTDEVVRTENSYSSPNVSVTIDTVETSIEGNRVVYYVADIYVASLDCFRTAIAGNTFSYFSDDYVQNMDIESNAVVSINGDYYSVQKTGFLVRNGELYLQDQTYCDICVLFPDGTVECIPTTQYTVADILARNPLQVWNFGPTLLDGEGHAFTEISSSNRAVNFSDCPRTALGYFEPGHYCFVVADGRQDGWSYGMSLESLAQVMEGLGCKTAYNMDGGGSSVMLFNHEKYSRMSNGDRKISDLIIVCDIPAVAGAEG